MKEEVYQIKPYPVGHRINRQLLVSLEEIFKQADTNALVRIETKCTNSTLYKFESIDECFSYFETSSSRIECLEMVGILGTSNNRNSITLTFDNSLTSPYTEIKFKFDNTDKYLSIKNKIELCLKNFRLGYRFFSIIPMIPIILTVVFWGICEYTIGNNIVFPKTVQHLIIATWILGCIYAGFFPFAKRLKRNLFPCTEFWIGQNENIEEKNKTIRNFIMGTIILSPVLGIVINYISGLLF